MANDNPKILQGDASDANETLDERVPFAAREPGATAGWVVPAWLLSLVFHLAAFLVAVIVVRPAASLPTHEPDRAATIVVARATDLQATTYLQEDSSSADDRATAAAAVKTTDAMPSSESAAAPLVAGIDLPKSVSLASADAGVALATSLGGGRSSRAKIERADDGPVGEVADPGPAEPAGAPVKLSIFGSAAAEGRSFVFVIDHSKSMGGSGLDVLHAAERQLTAALSRLAPEHWFQIIAYNETPTFLAGRRKLLDATDENKLAIQRFFADLVAAGATEHERALHAALALKPDVIFLLTDGGDPELTSGQLHEIRTHAAGRTAIHGLQFGFGPLQEAEPFLHRLASQNGGQFRYIDVTKK